MDHTLSQELIDKYLAGELSHEEAHRVEKIMLDSDFDQEAMDGFEEAYPTGGIGQDLSVLEKKIDQRTRGHKKGFPLWLKIAASLTILTISTFLILNMDFGNLNKNGLAKNSTVPLSKDAEQNEGLNEETDKTNNNTFSDSLLALNDTSEPEPMPEATTEESKSTFKKEVENNNSELTGLASMVESEESDEEEIAIELAEVAEESYQYDLKVSDPEKTSYASTPLNGARSSSIQPPKKLSGKIKSNTTGENMPGVTVMVKGKKIGTVTDINGNFSLDIPGTDDTVVISTIGFVSQELDIRSVESLEIGLDEDFSALSEVVVTGAAKTKTTIDTDANNGALNQNGRVYSEKLLKSNPEASKRERKAKRRDGFMGTRIISGTVLAAEDSLSLQGVNILVEGTPTYTQTDKDGNFKVQIPDDPETSLALAFIGLENTEVVVGDQENLRIYLLPDTTKQSDIVVVDYQANRESLQGLLTRARPAGGNKELTDYIAQNRQNSSESNGGKVIIEFTILPNGELSDFNVVKGLNNLKDKEAERLIKEGPKWIPASSDGQPQKDKVRVRIKFDK